MTVVLALILGIAVYYGLPWLHNKYAAAIPAPIQSLVGKILGLLMLGARATITICLIIIAYWVIPPTAKVVESVVGDELCLGNTQDTSEALLSNLNDKITGSWKVNTFRDNAICNWHLGISKKGFHNHGWNLQYPAEKYTDHNARFLVYSLNRQIVYHSEISASDREYLKDYLMVSEQGQMRASNMALRIFAYWYREDEEQGANHVFINGTDMTENALEALSIDADRDGILNDKDERMLDHRKIVNGFDGRVPIKIGPATEPEKIN